MSYVDGFAFAVPAQNREAFLDMASTVAPVFRKHGATRVVECWGDDVPKGKLNDFYTAVHARDGEVVVFAWIEWPSKEVRDSGMQKVTDEMPSPPGGVPFDGARMIFGGFRTILDA
ncbi:MAG: DUF1428 domain-containing protein [Maricaulaceae bacterium]|nr:DUF1428 domain-containing protein [Maricaulaceae bacterium]